MNESLAIIYKTTLDLSTILTNVGDSIKIFIPAPLFVIENPVYSEKRVYGPRPYSIQSDIVAICSHMGILLPGEKSKKNVSDALITSPNAPIFGREKIHEDTRKLENSFRVNGVLLHVIAVPPLESYVSTKGCFLTSQSRTDSHPVAIDILDYAFVNECENKPTIVDDPESILQHDTADDFFTPIDEEDLLTHQYSPDLFTCDKDGDLLKDFKVMLEVEGVTTRLKHLKNGNISVIKINDDNEEVLVSDVPYKNIVFAENSIKVGDFELNHIESVTFMLPDGTESE